MRAAETEAAVGSYVNVAGASTAILASVGHYVATTGASAQTTAAVGSYVDVVGASTATLASLGHYVATAGASAETEAAVGSYVNVAGASTAILASVGHYVATTGASAQTTAAVGSYVDVVGASTATLASVGHYVATTGASAQTTAAVGSYVDVVGASTAILASVGHYVATTGASAQTEALAGSYVPTAGASAATMAHPGFYVPTAGATAEIADPAGTFSLAGATAPTSLPPVLDFDSGTSSNDSITKSGVVNLAGLQTGAAWQYSLDGGQTFINGTGTSVDLTGAGDGQKTIIVHQTYDGVHYSIDSATLAFQLDTQTSVAITNSSGNVSQTNQTLSGTGEAGSSVSLTENGNQVASVIVDGTGHWTAAISLVNGANSIVATETDIAGNVATAGITLTLLSPANHAPTITSNHGMDSAIVHVSEKDGDGGPSAAQYIATITAIDPDAGDTLTYSISGGADRTLFSIDASSGVLTANPDAELYDGQRYTVAVKVTDSKGAIDTQTLTVKVDDDGVWTGRAGTADTFVVTPQSDRTNIAGFKVMEDTLQIHGSGFTSLQQMVAEHAAYNVGNNAVFDLSPQNRDDHLIVVRGVTVADFLSHADAWLLL